MLRPALDRLKRAGVAARANYALGKRPDAIGSVATRGRADLIVMGSRGHSGLKGLVFGSMTNAALAGCTKPLLVLRSKKAPQRDSLAVGIAVDGSRCALAAVVMRQHRQIIRNSRSMTIEHSDLRDVNRFLQSEHITQKGNPP